MTWSYSPFSKYRDWQKRDYQPNKNIASTYVSSFGTSSSNFKIHLQDGKPHQNPAQHGTPWTFTAKCRQCRTWQLRFCVRRVPCFLHVTLGNSRNVSVLWNLLHFWMYRFALRNHYAFDITTSDQRSNVPLARLNIRTTNAFFRVYLQTPIGTISF